jgi:outer membrane protein assembly factor BamB
VRRNSWVFALVFFALSLSELSPAVQVISQWTIPTRPKSRWDMQPQERTKPVVVGNILYYANLDGDVVAMHRIDGYELWRKKMPAGVNGALAYGRSRVYVGDSQGHLFAFQAHDGQKVWEFNGQGEWLTPPAVSKGLVIATNSADEVFALNEADGKERWHFSQRGDEKMTVRGGAAPVVSLDTVFQGFSDGTMAALSVETGRVQWNRRLRSRSRFYDVDMTPYVDDKSVFASTFDGKLYKLNRTTGEIEWLFPTGVYGGILVDQNKVIFAGLNGVVYALRKESPEILWKTTLEGGVGLAPSRVGDLVVIATSSDPVYLFDIDTGREVWKSGLGAGTLAAPAAQTDGWFYCMSNYGNLYSFEIRPDIYRKAESKTIPLPSALIRGYLPTPIKNPS